MSEGLKGVPEELVGIWSNLSYQMRGKIKAFGLSQPSLKRSDVPPRTWNRLSYQMRGRIASQKSMDESRRTGD